MLRNLRPDHIIISNFKRVNPKAIKKVFRQTVKIAKNFHLIGGKLLAGNGTKLHAQNSKKNNFNQKKIDYHIAYIDRNFSENEKAFVESDGDQKKDQTLNYASRGRRFETSLYPLRKKAIAFLFYGLPV